MNTLVGPVLAFCLSAASACAGSPRHPEGAPCTETENSKLVEVLFEADPVEPTYRGQSQVHDRWPLDALGHQEQPMRCPRNRAMDGVRGDGGMGD
jgi:hypothetical protein